MISKYCSSDFKSCNKFNELLVRLDNDADTIGQVRIPVSLPEAQGSMAERKSMALGLLGGGMSMLCYTLFKAGLLGDKVQLPLLIMLTASLLQLFTGMAALKRRAVRGIMFIGGGLFWTSLLALDILPAYGLGSSTAPLPMSGYLVLWGFFGLIPLEAGVQVNRSCRVFYGLGALFIFLLAAIPFTPALVQPIAWSAGAITGLSGLLAGLKYFVTIPERGLQLDRKKAKT